MDFRQLHYFVTVAEELHVGHAATRLGIAQPALSQHIRALEERLGVRLFIRANRRIALTEAGEAFLAESRQALSHATHAVRAAQRAARGETGAVRIGYVSSALAEATFLATLAGFGRDYPDVSIEMRLKNLEENLNGLKQELSDLIVVRGPLHEFSDSHDIFTYSDRPVWVTLPASHPLCAASSIDLNELAEETFLLPEDPPGCGMAHTVHTIFARRQFAPRRCLVVNETSSVIGLIAGGLGVALLPESARTLQLPGVEFRPLAGEAYQSQLLVVHRRFERSPSVNILLARLRQDASHSQSGT